MYKLLTRNGICRDLKHSPYTFTFEHKGKIVTLSFSSKLHLEKFTKNRQANYAMIYNNIYKRFKFKIDCRLLSDFNLYKKIENRGVYINIGDYTYTNFEDIIIK